MIGSLNALYYTGRGILVSAGNMGSSWGAFDGTPYSEIYHITLTTRDVVIPVPAAVWLMGSGLIWLLGCTRLGRRGGLTRFG